MITNKVSTQVANLVFLYFPISKSTSNNTQTRVQVEFLNGEKLENPVTIARVVYNEKRNRLYFSTTKTFAESVDSKDELFLEKINDMLLDLYFITSGKISTIEYGYKKPGNKKKEEKLPEERELILV